MGLAELREVMERRRQAWLRLLANNPDPAVVVREVDPDDGYQRDAPLALRLAGALHHGSEHRSQVCTALTLLGLDPPSIDPFTYGLELGTVAEVYPSA